MSVNGHGIELPSSWLRQRRSRRGDFARLRSQVRFGGGYTAAGVIWLDYVWPAAGGTTTVDYQVGASSSDSHMTSIANDSGRAVTTSGAVSLTLATLSPGSHGSGDEWSVAARFAGVAVDQGATVNSATFQLRCQNTWNASPNVIKFYISAQAADDAGALTATSGDLNTTARPRTTATAIVDWSSVTVDTWYSVDITSVVQEVVNRAGWANGNAIVILVDTHSDTTLSEWQDFYSYDGAAASAPKLSVTYASGGGGGTTLTLTGLGSSEAIGAPALSATLSLTGVASGEAFGVPTIGSAAASITLTGLASSEAIGAPAIEATLSPTGIASAEALGSPSIGVVASLTGIASGGAIGAPGVSAGLSLTGIAGAEAFGSPSIGGALSLTGVATGEAIGAPALSVVVTLTGVASSEAFGVPTVGGVPASVTLVGLASSEAVGAPALSVDLALTGIASAVAFGTPSVTPVVTLTGIAGAEAFGVPTVASAAASITLVGIASGEAFGVPSLLPPGIGIVTLTPTASDPDILVTVLRADVGVAAMGPGTGTMARRPALATTGARPDPAISGRG